jgi:hypothetical protein
MFSSRWALLLPRTRMKFPGSYYKLAWLAGVALVALAAMVFAQPSAKPKGNSAPAARPQVIYHVRPASDYAATLHSQAKGQNDDAPPDDGRSPSVEPTRPDPVTPEPSARRPAEVHPKAPALEPRPMKRPKTQSNHIVRPRAVKPPKQHGNPHGSKSHNK